MYTAIFAAALLANVLLLPLLFKRRYQAPGISTIFLVLVSLLAIWAATDMLNSLYLKGYAYELNGKIAALSYILIPPTFLSFAVGYSGRNRLFNRYWLWVILAITTLFWLFLAWTSDLIIINDFTRVTHEPWGYAAATAPLFWGFLAWFEIIMSIAVIFIIRFYRRTHNGIKRRQAANLIIAVLIPLIGGSITNGLLPILGYEVFPAAVPLTTLMSIMIAWAILKYGLFGLSPSFLSQSILRSMNEGLIVTDSAGNIQFLNQAAINLLGYSEAEALNLNLTSLMGESNALYLTREMTRPIVRDLSITKRGGESFIAELGANAILDPRGRPLGAIILISDITEKKQIEAAKDEFVSLASHQLRTPLTSIRLFTELLQGDVDNLSPKQKSYLEKIDLSTQRMIALVGDILNISRIDMGRLSVEPKPIQLEKLISEKIAELDPLIQARELKVSFSKSTETMPLIALDPILMDQIVYNLLDNAINYSHPRTGKIAVRLSKDQHHITLIVKDNGIGIPEAVKNRIFSRFFRSESAIRMKGSGTGLGLYLVKMIADLSGCQVRFDSQEGKGTTFYVTIPISGMRARSGEKSLSSTQKI